MVTLNDIMDLLAWRPQYTIVVCREQYQWVKDVIEEAFPPTSYSITVKASEYVPKGTVYILRGDERHEIPLPPTFDESWRRALIDELSMP